MKSLFVLIAGFIAFLVLLLPSVLPDVFPLIGALDEATATAILIACARYFGFDISRFFGKKSHASHLREMADGEETKQ